MRIRFIILGFVAACILTSCLSYDLSRRVVQQGNLLPESKINRLKIGMSKENAALLLGTSLLSTTFTENRWDYAYTWHRGSGPIKVKSISIYFNHNRISKIDKHF